MMTKKDFWMVLVIGAGVGLLVQPILINNSAAISQLISGGGFQAMVVNSIWPIQLAVFLGFLILAPLALWVASILARWVAVVYQVAKFAAVGSLNSFIDMGVFSLLSIIFGSPQGGTLLYAIHKTVSFLVATTNSFLWNKAWTFGDANKAEAKKVIIFYLVTGFNWAVNTGVATAVSAMRPDDKLWTSVIAVVCGIFAGMAGNFLGYKFIVFKKDAAVDNSKNY